ncbi:ethyl tert-butyl ether degradation EthD [Halovivax asiaticus JCM 14624]|uniref:Ethyl tert-butyl ether degradation EthD n=1 Tax=Halovivax asiaticus JCM 14624 TaxID=1227490 RepID=M0BTC4_9EURY|nr:EthD domain-containing protein [Halovivax asiaticus]ELZ14281.1 ethyl tert-butyl ether degradation EthD [Halovivax asiaticus JCM 14624]
MHKHVALLTRADGVSHDEFVDLWEATDLDDEIDGVTRYHEVLPTMPEHAEFDGLAEFFFADEAAYEDAVDDADSVVSDTGGEFAEAVAAERGMAGDPIVQRDEVDGDSDELYKHSAFLVRQEDMTHDEFIDHWQNNHTPIAREITGVVKYDTVVPTDPDAQPFDGIAELYFEDIDALYDALGSEGSRDYEAVGEMAEKAREDVNNFLAIDERPRFIGQEHLVSGR